MLKFRKKIFLSLTALSILVIAIFQQIIAPLAFSFCALVIVYYFTRPIQHIIDTMLLFEGNLLPQIDETNRDGERNQIASLVNSLTRRIQKQTENFAYQREETEEILESIGEGIIATDTSAQVTFVNQTACKMLGLSKSNLLKRNLGEFLSSDLSRKCRESILHALQTSETSMQTWILKGDLCLHLISMPLAHQKGALLVLQDKTSDYKVIEMGKDFIANASHELKTPITIIRGFAETLQDIPNISEEMLHQIAEKIVHTCGRLDKLVRSLLTLADIENLSEERFKKTDLVILIENCKHLFLAAHPNIAIVVREDCASIPITADADLLELAILNVLENAVKYSRGEPQIELWVEQIDKKIHINIRDAGIGIPEKDLSQIFNRFYTVDKAHSRKSGGAGLGLSIVKTVLEKHRGKALVSSELGKGSLFTLVLPQFFK